MSDKLYKISLTHLLKWILSEENEGKIFGIYKEQFFTPLKTDPFRFYRYNQLLETPVGVAAGPHTQLAQNIITAWLTGSRYIELKTVQTLDELEVSKPCIEMEDEGYNCEWSQELKIRDSFDEYLNAWILLHILRDKFGFSGEERGFIFNISVGYDLEGILKPNVQWFLDKMNNCEDELQRKLDEISNLYPRVKELGIPSKISDNVTLSTMHGCPPAEIESIATYLMSERKLHTAVKLNPTLLGPEKLRTILNEKLGYKTVVPGEAFEHDLKYNDAIRIINNLLEVAAQNNVEFGLKLTNTLESKNNTKELPENEKMVYMSGRALHPISINLAALLQNEFNGKLDISFSAGVDAFNISRTLKCNLKPVTVCSDLLKPGGYTRTLQYLKNLKREFKNVRAATIEEFILNSASESNMEKASVKNLNEYAEEVLREERYKKNFFKYENIKTERKLTPYDCIHAPCMEACAIEQDVPDYMYYTSKGEFDKALEVILSANPLPNITGMVCDHLCQSKCTRINLDNPLLIREIKRFNAEKGNGTVQLNGKAPNGIKVAVIGAGPSGLSAAYFLALEGFEVNVFEEKKKAGGMVSAAIPVFRIDEQRMEDDIKRLEKLGVKFIYNYKISKSKFDEIRKEHSYVFVGVGAKKGKKLNIKGENFPWVFDQLEFLAETRTGNKIGLGKQVLIIGGGNSAMDAARTAKRIVGKNGKVTVVYRRTRKEMPADKEEVEALIGEGIELMELVSPLEIIEENGKRLLRCIKMELNGIDNSGRPKPVPVEGSVFSIETNSIITAIGQDIEVDFFPEEKILIDQTTRETQLKNVFAGGDLVRGADSLINAMADGKYAAGEIIKRAKSDFGFYPTNVEKDISLPEIQAKLAERKSGPELPVIPVEERLSFELVHPLLSENQAIEEADRCLYCNDVCNICVSVCPNISNIGVNFNIEDIKIPNLNNTFDIEPRTFRISQKYQIINIGDFCNECGNCYTFCPTSGAPYKIKPKFYLTKESFDKEDNCYLLLENKLYFKKNNRTETLTLTDSKYIYESDFVKVDLDKNDYSVTGYEIKERNIEVDLAHAIEMVLLFKNLKDNPLFAKN